MLLVLLATAFMWLLTVTAATAQAAGPINSAPPTISGNAQEGATLTEGHGTWTPAATSFTYQWMLCSPACAAITGATGQSYVAQAVDLGHTIEVQETATVAAGSTAATSGPTAAVVVPPAPAPTSAPSISGIPQPGSVLSVTHGGWTNNPTSYTDTWSRCNTAGTCATTATGPTYALTAADLGATLVVLETASNAGNGGGPSSSSVYSAATGVVSVVPVNTSPPAVSGSTQQGQTLQETPGTWTNNPTGYIYQWERCDSTGCVAVPGATGQSYTTTAADVGASIVVQETAQNGGGSGAATASAPTAVITATSSISVVNSSQARTTNQTVTLVATVSSSSPNAAPSGSITFFAGASPISGCAADAVHASGQTAAVICQTAFPAGPVDLSAVYTPAGGAAIGGSTSPLTTLNVGRDSTATSLAVTTRIVAGKRVTYTATMVLPASNSGPLGPTGSIEFLDGGRPIQGCRALPLSRLAASCTVRYKALRRHRISALYSGDSNFTPSSSPTRAVQVVKASSQALVLGFVSATLQWQFNYFPTYTQVTMLHAFGVSGRMTVSLACQGRSCTFSQHRIQARRSGSIDLLPAFRNRHLRGGAQIIVRITRPHWIGKYYSFRIRPGRAPLITLSCLGVGGARPGVGC